MSPGSYRAPMRGALDRALALGLVGMGEADDERAARRLERFAAVLDGAEGWTRDEAEPLGEHQVPAAVAETFRRGGRNFQRIRAS